MDGELKCSHCERTVVANGMCATHWKRMREGRQIDAPVITRAVNLGKTCSTPDCAAPAKKLGMCVLHYERNRQGAMAAVTCPIGGCARFVSKGGMCERHYLAQYRRANPKLCAMCKRPSIAKNLCAAHYSREKRGYDQGKPLVPRYKGRACQQPGCVELARNLGYCRFHYTRLRDGVPMAAPKYNPSLDGHVNAHGYRVIKTPAGKFMLEHRWVMSQIIGRPLFKNENVHHKSGDKLENAPSNLELWVKTQPCGQRVSDKVAHAREILRIYGALFPEESSAAE